MKIELSAAEAINIDRLYARVEAAEKVAQEATLVLSSAAMEAVKSRGDMPENPPSGFKLELDGDKAFLVLEGLPPVEEVYEDEEEVYEPD